MLVMFTAFCLPARLQLFATSPACQGMEAYSINHADVFSVLSNTASLAQLKSSSVGLISERRFLLSELNSVAAVLGPINKHKPIFIFPHFVNEVIFHVAFL